MGNKNQEDDQNEFRFIRDGIEYFMKYQVSDGYIVCAEIPVGQNLHRDWMLY